MAFYVILSHMKKPNTVKFGEHLIFDAYKCDPKKLNDKKFCTKVLLDLANIAGMKKLIDPVVVKASENETLGGKDPGGYSGFLIIQESHISVHTFTKRGFVTADLYSCKPFVFDGVVDYLVTAFKPKDYSIIKMDRGLKYPSKNIY